MELKGIEAIICHSLLHFVVEDMEVTCLIQGHVSGDWWRRVQYQPLPPTAGACANPLGAMSTWSGDLGRGRD